MKIRTDFVTNSSSSSFVVTFETVPTSVEELQTMLFGEAEFYSGNYSDELYPTKDIAKVVFNDMKDGSAELKEIMEELSESGKIEGCPRYDDYKDYGAYNLAVTVFMTEYMQKHYTDLSNIFIFSYSDNDGSRYSAMEHGDLFNMLKHVKVSHH